MLITTTTVRNCSPTKKEGAAWRKAVQTAKDQGEIEVKENAGDKLAKAVAQAAREAGMSGLADDLTGMLDQALEQAAKDEDKRRKLCVHVAVMCIIFFTLLRWF